MLLGAFLAGISHTAPVVLTGFATTRRAARPAGRARHPAERLPGADQRALGAGRRAAPAEGIPCLSVWAAVPHYLAALPNPKVCAALLRAVDQVLDLKLDLHELDDAAATFETQVGLALSRTGQTLALATPTEPAVPTDEPAAEPEPLPPADEVVEGVEEFFRATVRPRSPAPGAHRAVPGAHRASLRSNGREGAARGCLRRADAGLGRPLAVPRARELGLALGLLPPGELDAITDVPGVRVGHVSIVEGEAVRTGVTAILTHDRDPFQEKTPAAAFVLNGFGKTCGLPQVAELGVIETPILLTGTLAVPRVADALIDWTIARNPEVLSVNPVVGECNDGYLNDIQGRHVRAEHVFGALEGPRPARSPRARSAPASG